MSSRTGQLLEMLKQEPGDPFLNYALALEYSVAGEKTKAITILEQLIERSEDYLGTYYTLGQLLEQTGNTEKAKIIYEKGIKKARQVKNTKTCGELLTALELLD